MVKRIIFLIIIILPYISYSQKHSDEFKGNLELNIELVKDSISFGDSLCVKIKYKNISNSNINICIPSILFIVEDIEGPYFRSLFDVMYLNKEMKGDIKDLMPNEEVVLNYKIILKKLDFLHLGHNKLVLNYTYYTKKKKNRALIGSTYKPFDLYIL